MKKKKKTSIMVTRGPSLSLFFFFAERKRKTCELFFTDYNAAIQHREILYF